MALVTAPAASGKSTPDGLAYDVLTPLEEMQDLMPAAAGAVEDGKVVVAGTGKALDELDIAVLKIAGEAATAATATALTIQVKEITFTATGAGTYTGTVVVPAGSTTLDVIARNSVLWDSATSASLTVGDDDDADGYITATNLKTTPSADTNGAAAGLSTRLSLGASAGAYKGGAGKFNAAEKTITATIVAVGAGNAGRTRVLVEYAVPSSAAASKV
jgi:hypothetical protein